MVYLNYRDARPIYIQIVEGFQEQIRAGALTPGEKLPSVRELASQLAINPNTIQRAYRELEILGWTASMPGKGCFVHGIPTGTTPQQERLLKTFDEITEALLASGVCRKDLADRILEGGSVDA